MRTTHRITTKLGSYLPLGMLITRLDCGGILLETFFSKFSLNISDVFFLGPNTVLNISQEWLVRLMWNEKEVHRMDTG